MGGCGLPGGLRCGAGLDRISTAPVGHTRGRARSRRPPAPEPGAGFYYQEPDRAVNRRTLARRDRRPEAGRPRLQEKRSWAQIHGAPGTSTHPAERWLARLHTGRPQVTLPKKPRGWRRRGSAIAWSHRAAAPASRISETSFVNGRLPPLVGLPGPMIAKPRSLALDSRSEPCCRHSSKMRNIVLFRPCTLTKMSYTRGTPSASPGRDKCFHPEDPRQSPAPRDCSPHPRDDPQGRAECWSSATRPERFCWGWKRAEANGPHRSRALAAERSVQWDRTKGC